MLLTLRPLHFLMSAISFPQIFQVCTTIILLSIMWFLCSFADWVQASRIMRSMCRENMLLKNTYISFICMMKRGEDHLSISKGSKCEVCYGIYKGEKKRSASMPKVGGGQLLWSEATPIRIKETSPTPQSTLSSLATFIFNVILMLLWGVFKFWHTHGNEPWIVQQA